MKFYITFGQIHVHRVNGKTFDCDCIAEIEAEDMTCARERAAFYFELKWHQCVPEERLDDEFMSFFPRGIIKVENNDEE